VLPSSIRPWLAAHKVPVAAVAVVSLGAVWMLLPAIDERGGVVIVADRDGAVAVDDMVSQLRQNGRATDVLTVVDDSCVAVEAADLDGVGGATGLVVIAVAEPGECDDDPVRRSVEVVNDAGLTPVVVRFPGVDIGEVDAMVVDTEVLLGPPGDIERPCEWWDRVDPFGAEQEFACSGDDTVVVRFADGGLTSAGTQRVARMVAAAIG
jgi:hypothetical protein